MSASPVDPAAVVATHAAFITSGIAIDIAAREADLTPRFGVGCGCRVDRAAGRVTVFTHRAQSWRLLAALAQVPAIAVTFGRPSDHRSLQLKGDDARIEALAPGDAECMRAYLAAFTADMASFGASPALAVGYINLEVEAAVAISFAPRAAFDQTPGPGAGAPLAS